MTCECCRQKDGRTRVGMGRYTADLCDGCADGGHARDVCLCSRSCRAVVWTCAQLAHVSLVHPRVLEKRIHDYALHAAAPPPKQQEILGRILLGPRGEGL